MNGQNLGDFLGGFGALALGTLVVFLVGREFFCWYWKINQRLALLSQIRDLLKSQAGELNKRSES